MMRRRAGLALLATTAVVAGGCGSGSSKTTSSTSSQAPAPAKTEAPKASSGGAAKAGAATIKDFTFTPGTITVKAGGTVKWTNKDSANHNVTFDDKSVKGIGNLRTGQGGTVSFAKAGTYAYVCTYHPGMKGKVIVQ